MKTEFNKSNINEINAGDYNDIVVTNEVYNNDIAANEEIKEQAEIEEKKKSKSSFKLGNLMSSLVSMVVVGVTAITAATTATFEVDIKFDDFTVTDTSIEYSLNVSDYEETTLTLVIDNKFTNRKVAIDDNHISGVFEDLQPSMTYVVKVVMPSSFDGEKVLSSQEITTLSTEDYRTARFIDIETECRCQIDGYFYFKMNYVDNLNVFTDFTAYLEDESGNVSYCEFYEDTHEQQKILVTGSELTGNKATLYIYCYNINEEIDEQILCYQVDVSI